MAYNRVEVEEVEVQLMAKEWSYKGRVRKRGRQN